MIVDPHFPGLPPIPANSAVAGAKTAGGDLTRATDSALAAAAWKIIAGAIQEFSRRAAADLLHPGLIIGGDMSIVRDRVAIGGSNFAQIRTDEGAHFISSVTALIEALAAKGTATAVGAMRTEMTAAADRLGRDAVARAFALRNGERPAAGNTG